MLAAYNAYEFHTVYQKISQFVSVQLSAIYHDVVKDRLYTDPANSPRRRSTQTALHRLVSGLCTMLSPILAFTADEAWEALPGKTLDAVHLADWPTGAFTLQESEALVWSHLFQLRELVLPVLEKERQAKTIGKALEASVTISGSGELLKIVSQSNEPLRELLNVSQLDIQLNDSKEIQITVGRASGQKCDRCWHWETDVGSHSGHATLCGRCVEAVQTAAV